jgi:hypothetical protein
MRNEVVPELHLTRWLRCLLSREFALENCLLIWDFIFVNPDNLNFVCVAMIQSKRKDLLESDFSMCLGLLMSFKEPTSVIEIIRRTIEIKKSVENGTQYVLSESSDEQEEEVSVKPAY